ncbi:Mur ligase family protein [Lysobacter koreensis]|uniref:Mur ligase family protein n=1 Tax=Lysobacter koreensis TaxID=266122 RepID=A0ABW2YL29_9GAMM
MRSEPPFDESRRLTGSNLYFDGPGAALETLGAARLDEAALAGWQARIGRVRDALCWPHAALVVRRHASGASLAFAAPLDQLYTAAEANEWAWRASLHAVGHDGADGDAHAPGYAPAWDEVSALRTFGAMAAEEANPALLALLAAARARGLPAHADDDLLSIGEGVGSRSWPVRELPAPAAVPWAEVRGIPLAVVTGSNGKTTTVRLLAAMARAHGWSSGYSSTDGLFVGAQRVDSGDYSGPVGARTVLRHPGVEAAILETARGGLLRRGTAIHGARVAVVTNISPDHFGEYGIHDLDDLAQVKLSVTHALARDGLLVLNADDPLLSRRGEALAAQGARIGWFALDDAHPRLRAQRAAGGATCGVRDARLWLSMAGATHDLGEVSAMPITLAGSAGYNIANAAAAALAAAGMGIAIDAIADVLARFGAQPGDNPGRLQRWRYGGGQAGLQADVQVFLDYAHNPDGLRGLLHVAGTTRAAGRLGLILGQAGNREDSDIRALAAVAAGFAPDRVWLKDIGGEYMRGREPGEIAAILRDELLRQGVADSALLVCLEEARAAREALRWARAGDVLVLPIHDPAARDDVVALLDRLQEADWRAGTALPDA